MSRPSPPVPTEGRLRAPLIESPAFVFMQVGRLAMNWAAEALELFELTLAEFATLALIHRTGPMSQDALAERLGISKAAMSGLATSLEDAGLAERRMHMCDGRKRALTITRAGTELVAEASDELAVVDAQFLERVGEDVVGALAELAPPNLTPIEMAFRWLGRD
jgi:DNA-binding MarR family transcriptional regulator